METILNFIFPKRCIGCRKTGYYLCSSCQQQLVQKELICPQCTHASIDGRVHPICAVRFGMDGLWSLGAYQGTLKKAIQRLKYRFVATLADPLIDLWISYWAIYGSDLLLQIKADPAKWVIVSVPLSKARLKWRGFNQSSLLAEGLSIRLELPFVSVLEKVIDSAPQASLSRRLRLKNNKEAFILKDPHSIEGKSILLVDDVWTTGATMRECAWLLKKGGAKQVWGLTLAR